MTASRCSTATTSRWTATRLSTSAACCTGRPSTSWRRNEPSLLSPVVHPLLAALHRVVSRPRRRTRVVLQRRPPPPNAPTRPRATHPTSAVQANLLVLEGRPQRLLRLLCGLREA